MRRCLLLAALLVAAPVLAVQAQEDAAAEGTAAAPISDVKGGTGKVFPRYASVKKGEVNVRSGPGNQYPILWVYQRPGYPVQLLTRYDNYFKIRDAEGEEGWVYIGMVSARKTGLVGGQASGQHPVALYRHNDPTSDVVARVAPGVVVTLENAPCAGPYCEVDIDGTSGWIVKSVLEMVD